jgi:hypothetical protein
LLVKVALEHDLEDGEIETLARFRQGYQSLREAIRENRRLDWRGQPGHGDASEQYSAFKRLATFFASLLSAPSLLKPKPRDAQRALERATSVTIAGQWWK